MGCECIKCKFRTVVEDNNDELLSICCHRDSDNFLKQLSVAFDKCEVGELEDMYLDDDDYEYAYDEENGF